MFMSIFLGLICKGFVALWLHLSCNCKLISWMHWFSFFLVQLRTKHKTGYVPCVVIVLISGNLVLKNLDHQRKGKMMGKVCSADRVALKPFTNKPVVEQASLWVGFIRGCQFLTLIWAYSSTQVEMTKMWCLMIFGNRLNPKIPVYWLKLVATCFT